MTRNALRLGIDVIRYTFDRLPLPVKLLVVEDLERQTRKDRWDPLITKLRKRYARKSLTKSRIDRICEDVRQSLYAKRVKSSH